VSEAIVGESGRGNDRERGGGLVRGEEGALEARGRRRRGRTTNLTRAAPGSCLLCECFSVWAQSGKTPSKRPKTPSSVPPPTPSPPPAEK